MQLKIIAPENCPSCGSELQFVNDQLFCINSTECPAQSTKKLKHFCTKLKIKGFGEKTLEKLQLGNIPELFSYTQEYGISCGLGEKTALNLYNEITRIQKHGIALSEFLAALSIPLVGDGATRKIIQTRIEDITYDSLRDVGIGDKAATNLVTWIEDYWSDLKNIVPKITNTNKPKAKTIKGDVCITGKLQDFKSRNLAKQHLESIGWNVKSSVTKSVKYLICEDGNTASSSYKKALDNGIEILTIKSLEDI